MVKEKRVKKRKRECKNAIKLSKNINRDIKSAKIMLDGEKIRVLVAYLPLPGTKRTMKITQDETTAI